jgi:signal transduction histidine kinase
MFRDCMLSTPTFWLFLDPAVKAVVAIGVAEGQVDLGLATLVLPMAWEQIFDAETCCQLGLLVQAGGLLRSPLSVTFLGAIGGLGTWGAWLDWDGQFCRLDVEPLGDPLPLTALALELAAIAPLAQTGCNLEFWTIVQRRLQGMTGHSVRVEPSQAIYGPMVAPTIGITDAQSKPADIEWILPIGPIDTPWARAIVYDRPLDSFSYSQRVLLSLWARSIGLEFANHLNRHHQNQAQTQAENLSRANQELERSNRELQSFAYAVSHDLKEPLRGIHNYATFLREDYADLLDEAGLDRLQTLVRLSDRMAALIDALLEFSRLGQVALNLRAVDLQGLVEWVIQVLRMGRPELPFEITIVQPLPIVHCDPVLIGEVFTNLISNALKYNDQLPRIEIGSQSTAEGLLFYVRDNGIGIRDRHLSQIFRLFKRLHPKSRYGGGTGAGLTIARKIIERHGGQIWVESDWGRGSTFYFNLGKTDHLPSAAVKGQVP